MFSSAVRMKKELIVTNPGGGVYSIYASPVREVWGEALIKCSITSDNTGTLSIQGGSTPTGPWVVLYSTVSVLDATSGFWVADVSVPTYGRRYVRCVYNAGMASVGPNFNMQAYLLPVGDGLDDAHVSTSAAAPIAGQTQVFNVETIVALGGGITFTGATRDCQTYGGFGVSVVIGRLLADTNVNVLVESSTDGITWYTVDTQNIAVTLVAPTAVLNRVYSTIRRYMRITLINMTAAACGVTDASTVLKPIP